MNLPGSVVELLSALVRIQSVNPDGVPGVADPGEGACAAYVAEFLKAIGAEVEMQEVQPGRPNVIGRFPHAGAATGKRVILAPHTDTVSVVGMTIDPFSGEVRDGRLWGRGASDTKGPMAAMLWALRDLGSDAIANLGHEIWFVGLMSEEAGQYGAKAFVESYVEAHGATNAASSTFALIGEPTSGQIIHAHKGSCRLDLVTNGVAAHSSIPEQGSNAIDKMLSVLQYLREEIAPELVAVKNPLLGSPNMNIGVIQGGVKVNIVPDRCEAMVSFRTVPELYAGDVEWGRGVVAQLKEIEPGLEVELVEAAPLWTDPAHPAVRALERAGMRCGGAPWYCDAAVFSRAGIPAVAAGPGDIAQAHTCDEFISIDDLQRGVEFYTNFLQQL